MKLFVTALILFSSLSANAGGLDQDPVTASLHEKFRTARDFKRSDLREMSGKTWNCSQRSALNDHFLQQHFERGYVFFHGRELDVDTVVNQGSTNIKTYFWMPSGLTGYLNQGGVNGTEVIRIDKKGNLIIEYSFGRKYYLGYETEIRSQAKLPGDSSKYWVLAYTSCTTPD